MVEDFSDFKREGNLTLPHAYKLLLEIENTAGLSIQTWDVNIGQFAFDQDIDESSFNVEAE
jgi:hypothetical protein